MFRVYEGSKDNLRAVMHDVVAFRDERIAVKESVPKEVTVSQVKQIGDKQDVDLRVVQIGDWIDPDNEAIQIEALPVMVQEIAAKQKRK